MDPRTRWYVAVLVIEYSVEGDRRLRPETELQFQLLHARGDEAAWRKAVRTGAREEMAYENVYGQRVRCRFRGLADLKGVFPDEFVPGRDCEVYWTFVPEVGPFRPRRKQNLTVFKLRPKVQSRFLNSEFSGRWLVARRARRVR